tara:strand:+ start:116 stop:352 length:237 start_codon:yes stop_codon:yes gene_type:complete
MEEVAPQATELVTASRRDLASCRFPPHSTRRIENLTHPHYHSTGSLGSTESQPVCRSQLPSSPLPARLICRAGPGVWR